MNSKPALFSFTAEANGQLKIEEEDFGSSRTRDVDYRKSSLKGSTLRYHSEDGYNRFEAQGPVNPSSNGGGIRQWPLSLGLEFHIIAMLLSLFKSVVGILKDFVKA
ncbi:hypothetical protein DFP72DRAFT_1064674 [Ephemerocybe angulata]|uniref:Uncharacterized protein n=1 Tax=Ephemerocybe angulata TaxID=980116 RepID=A0A8H6MBZ7_9AGAR|nr:hypothetical protein DFP72DRAFT_1064674 [Tulosesus angulatus]